MPLTVVGRHGNALRNTNIAIKLKRKVFEAYVLSLITCGMETATLTDKATNKFALLKDKWKIPC